MKRLTKNSLNKSSQKRVRSLVPSRVGFPVQVGILGGGQLARLLALSARSLGVTPHIYASKNTDCATQVVSDVTYADGTDERLKKFISQVDHIVIENEFIDLDQLERCLDGRRMTPDISVLRLVQSKLEQKKSLKKHGIATLNHHEVNNQADLKEAMKKLGRAVVLKTARNGYDGKGTFIFKKGVEAEMFFRKQPDFRGYAEPLVNFKRELAVIVARSHAGEIKTFPVVESNQEGGICRWVRVLQSQKSPAPQKAIKIAKQVIASIKGSGVFGVELFELKSGEIVVNEIAPRVHNTGHYTSDLCEVSQFGQHLRCALNWPLLETRLNFAGGAMVNILGDSSTGEIGPKDVATLDLSGLKKISRAGEGFWIYWYGKTGPAAGRKIGHINAHAKTSKRALAVALRVREALKV